MTTQATTQARAAKDGTCYDCGVLLFHDGSCPNALCESNRDTVKAAVWTPETMHPYIPGGGKYRVIISSHLGVHRLEVPTADREEALMAGHLAASEVLGLMEDEYNVSANFAR